VDDRSGGDSVGRGPALADFFIILLLLVSNAAVGFWEERQAGNAIAALKAKLAVNAKVKRLPRKEHFCGPYILQCASGATTLPFKYDPYLTPR
jgi:hypothetical protein